MRFLALQGVRVIEVATGIAGPFCGKLLADYGAEVLKVERPGSGDSARYQGPYPGNTPHLEKSGLFLHLNANKKGITLDISHPAGQDLLRRLVPKCHILIESHRPGELGTLGLGYHDLCKLRPGLVMTSITPFGQTGPHKDYEFTELTIFAMTGAMYREGIPERHPLKYGGEISQYFAGSTAAAATMAASLKSFLAGQGRWIDISIQECMAGHPHQAGRRAPFAYDGEPDLRRQPHSPMQEQPDSFASGTFSCKDGHVSLLPLGTRMWPNVARMIGRPELLEDPRYATPQDRAGRFPELKDMVQAWMGSHTREEIFAAGQGAGVPCAPVLTADEVVSNEHLIARDYFADIRHPDAGSLAYPGLPFGLSDAPSEQAMPAPRLGQHNHEVFGEILGIGRAELKALGRQGVV